MEQSKFNRQVKKLSEQMKENRTKIFTIHKLKPNKRIRDT